MRVVRAILGRFARFLVRVARTLDPGLVATPYWVIPERMAALRQRYPGAPEHWLELVARRTSLSDTTDPRSPKPHPVAPADDRIVRPASLAQPLLRNVFRKRERQSPRFPQSVARSSHQTDSPDLTVRTDSPDISVPRGAPRAARPRLLFGVKFVRNPIANLLRIDRPARRVSALHFDARGRHDRPQADHDEEENGIERRDHPTFFPDLAEHEARPLDLRWPVLMRRAPDQPPWRDEPSSRGRPDPAFARNDNRWPELPPLAVEFGFSDAPAHDEVALLAEQIGGTWSE